MSNSTSSIAFQIAALASPILLAIIAYGAKTFFVHLLSTLTIINRNIENLRHELSKELREVRREMQENYVPRDSCQARHDLLNMKLNHDKN